MSFLSYLINGISLGSVYAIIALGYTMVYGIAKMLNFAHGDIIMVGGFTVFTIVSTAGGSPVVGVLALDCSHARFWALRLRRSLTGLCAGPLRWPF